MRLGQGRQSESASRTRGLPTPSSDQMMHDQIYLLLQRDHPYETTFLHQDL